MKTYPKASYLINEFCSYFVLSYRIIKLWPLIVALSRHIDFLVTYQDSRNQEEEERGRRGQQQQNPSCRKAALGHNRRNATLT